MGGSVSQVFRSGSALLSNRDGHKVSKTTEDNIQTIFEILRANPKISIHTLEGLLLQIPKVKCINIQNTVFIYKLEKNCFLIFFIKSIELNRMKTS